MQTMTIQLYNSSYLHDGIMLKKKWKNSAKTQKLLAIYFFSFLKTQIPWTPLPFFKKKVYLLKSTSPAVSKFCTFSDFKDQGTYTFCFTTPSQFS